ncbi:ICMT-domain-containing protein [Panus rudis PR-1116 ss-1]|nr:ICMT-domain-containing protein [Panus rudis PR-1116 ss-1]
MIVWPSTVVLAPGHLKIALLLLAGASVHLSLSPPNPPAPPKQCIHKRTLFERCVHWVTFISKAMIWMATLSDAIATFALTCSTPHHPSPFRALTWMTPSGAYSVPGTLSNLSDTTECITPPPSSRALLTPSPLFAIGVLSVFLGALLRLWCFRSLGSMFTFELTIQPSHSLVTTGPYAFVRHPSYAGIYLTLLGGTLVALAPSTWLYECWLSPAYHALTHAASASSSWPWKSNSITSFSQILSAFALPFSPTSVLVHALIAFWLFKVWYALRSTNRRLHIEDRELHKVFGEVWEHYAEKVRWKLLPGVF